MDYDIGHGSDVPFEESRGGLNSGPGVSGSNDASFIQNIVDNVNKNVRKDWKRTYISFLSLLSDATF